MPSATQRPVIRAIWTLNLLIVFEIIFMISPFSLYYYSAYGSALNFLHQWPETAWLTGFFLPHYTKTASVALNSIPGIGWSVFLLGLAGFLAGAGQIYYNKFHTKKAVTGGIYRLVRHPQYTCFAVMGFGLLLIWPRFFVLIFFCLMLFGYYFLARKEEKECLSLFGDTYRGYLNTTSMFLPGDGLVFRNLPAFRSSFARVGLSAFMIVCVTLAGLSTAFVVRDFAISKVTAVYTPNSATISTALLDPKDAEAILEIALDNVEVQQRISANGPDPSTRFLNYIVPTDWFLPDLPMEPFNLENGHVQPDKYDPTRFKVLITQAELFRDPPALGSDIIKMTYRRTPLVLVKVNMRERAIEAVETPPPHVKWGDIPTPLF